MDHLIVYPLDGYVIYNNYDILLNIFNFMVKILGMYVHLHAPPGYYLGCYRAEIPMFRLLGPSSNAGGTT